MSELTVLSSNPAAIVEDAALFAAVRAQWRRSIARAKKGRDDEAYNRLMDERLAFHERLAAGWDRLSTKAQHRVKTWVEGLGL